MVKKILKWFGICLGVILLALVLIPIAFSGKIKDIAVEEANKMLKSNVYVEDVSLSFFKNFPHASVTLEKFGVAGKNEFSGDTLVDAEKFVVVISTRSLFTDHYVVDAVELKNAKVTALVNDKGVANWDIMKEDSTAVETDTTAAESTSDSPFTLSIQKVNLENINVRYSNTQDGTDAKVNNLNLNLSVDMKSGSSLLANVKKFNLSIDSVAYSDTTMSAGTSKLAFNFEGKVSDAFAKLKSNLNIENVNFVMQHIPYLSNVLVNADVNVDADLDNNKYTLGENSFALNEVKANLSGFVQMIDSTAIDMDLKFNTPQISFKDILSLIPAIYKNDFASLKADGKVALDAFAKGRMEGDKLPSFDVKLVVDNALIKYPTLPKQIDNINISAQVQNPGGIADQTVVNVDKFSFVMAGNPFAAHLKLKTPVSDPDFDCGIKGRIDFGSVNDVLALTGMKLNGLLVTDASAAGRLSYVEKEQFDKFSVNGNLNVENVSVKGDAIGYNVEVPKANLDFSNQFVDLTVCDVKIDKNDIRLKGRVEDFIPYLFKDGTIRGNLSLNSSYLNVNDLLGEETPSETPGENEKTEEPSSSESIDIPANIDFALNMSIDKLIYSNIEMNQVKGAMNIRNKVATISNLSTNTMEGSLAMKGSYDSRIKDNGAFKASLDVKQMSIPVVFSTVNTARKFVPLLSNAEGKFNMQIDLMSKIDGAMTPILNTVDAKGKFTTNELKVKEFDVLTKIAEAVKYSDLKNGATLKNVAVKFAIKDGRMTTEPFDVSIDNVKMNVLGSSGLDETLDYKSVVTIPNALSAKTNIPLAFDVLVGGTFLKPSVKVSAKNLADNVKEVVTEKVKETVHNTVNKALEEAKAQQKKILAEAQKQASALKAEAVKQGDKIVAEAELQGKKMVDNCKNPLEKKVKQKAADKMVSEAQKQRDKLISEADAKGKSIISTAQTKSDNLIKEAEKKNNQ